MSKGYEAIANELLTCEVNGKWTPPWHKTGLELPQNAITGHHYQGINVLATWVSAQRKGYATHLWATYKQWNEAGAQVKKGSKSTPVVLFKPIMDPDTGKAKSFMVRQFCVFNRDQVEGAPDIVVPTPLSDSERDARVEHFVGQIPATIEQRPSSMAFYMPSEDRVVMPLFEQFKSGKRYYGTLLHELSHWTGHPTREDRTMGKRFGDDAYAMEELVAELSSVFTAIRLGLEPEIRKDHAKYIQHWHRKLKDDAPGFAHAVALAQKASNHLLSYEKEVV